MVRCLIGFGSNSGDLQSWFEQSIGLLKQNPKIDRIRHCPPVRTRAVLGRSDTETLAASEYLNSVISLETSLDAVGLFKLTRAIETQLGRVRGDRWSARTVDLDILLFGDQVIETPQLIVPHPRMAFRGFVLQGAMEIAADMVHPLSGVTIETLWDRIRSAPRKMLWLVADDEALNAARVIRHQLKTDAKTLLTVGGQYWEIEICLQLPATALIEQGILPEQYALLLYTGSASTYREAARWFAGPTLNLVHSAPDFLQREIAAAVEAMPL